MNKKKLIKFISAVAFLLSIPLIAMQFTDVVEWTLLDFMVAAVLLLGGGLIFDFIIRKVKNPKFKIGLCITTVVLILLVFAEMAVGVFGTCFSGQ